LNLEIAKGEFLTMLGPSDSGKTTTLMMLAGFELATQSEIFVQSQPINNSPPHKRGMWKNSTVNLEWAWIADGADAKDVCRLLATPEGVAVLSRNLIS
jgi:ABC-type nitrate/sulfonate/bicarbonate transport system ATPase subunit